MGGEAPSTGGDGERTIGRLSRNGDEEPSSEVQPAPINSDNGAARQEEDRKKDAVVLYEESYHPPFLWALVLFPPVIPLFWTYRVQVTESDLTFGYSYGFTSKTVPRSSIRSADVVPHVRGLRDWGGWGIRLNSSFEWGYISKNGPGIRVTLAKVAAPGPKADSPNDSEELVAYTFLCADAERVAKMLSSSVPSRSSSSTTSS